MHNRYKQLVGGLALAIVFFIAYVLTTANPNQPHINIAQAQTVPGFVVNHSNLHLFDQIPSQYIEAARNMNMMWGDRSVGGNISSGLDCLTFASSSVATNSCIRNHSVAEFQVPTSELTWNYGTTSPYIRSNWDFFFDPGLGVPNELVCPTTTGQFNWIGCFIEHAQNNINSYDVFSYQHSYLVGSDNNIMSPTSGYFVDRSNGWDIYDYERLESQNPTKKFIYWTTSLARSMGNQTLTDYNSSMRSFATSRNKVLFDVADILSHDYNGNPCYDNRDGVPYYLNGTLRENHADDGINFPAICQHYTTEAEGGHLAVASGMLRTAKGYWITMAYLAGWRPGSTNPPPPPPPTDTTPPSTPSNLSATAASTTQINLSWTASTDNVGVTGYRVERCSGSTCTGFSQIATPSGTSYSDTGLTASTTYRYRVRAADAASNLSSYSSIVNATTQTGSDTTPPTVSVSSPINGATVSGTISITANASDNVGVAGVQFRLNGANLGSEDTSAPYSTSWNSTTVANGSYTLTAVARDTSNNTTTSSSITVNVSNAASTFTLTVSRTGTGTGTVTGTGINCGTDCTETVNAGTVINLNASAATGSTFAGWSGGGCSGTGGCTVTVNANTTVTATFNTTTTTPPPPPPPPAGGNEDWPMAAQNPQRTSNSPANVTTVSGITWYRPIEAFISNGTQLITWGGRVYIATSKGLIVLNAENGTFICRFDTELPVATPTVDNGNVYLPGFDRKLYSLNATTCAQNWAYTAPAGFSANPIVSGGNVYVGNRDGRFYAINASNGSLVWSYLTGGALIESAALDAGVLYFASMDMYGYAINASNGSLVWRTPQKLPGDRYATWWPVIHGNYVVWSGSNAYKLNGNPGDQNAPVPGIGYDAFFNSSTSQFAGTLIASSDGSHGWPTGTPVMNTVTGTTPYTLQSWVQTMPAGRVYSIVNRSNGSEPFYLPWMIAGENGDGQMHPPVSDGNALYFNTLYQGSTQNIPRSTVFAWKDGTTWLRRLSATSFAVDEPLILSMANGRLYANLCCDRIAMRIDASNQNFWSYGPGMLLHSRLPSQGEPNSYDPMWNCYNGANFLERLGCYFNGNGSSINGVINSHGMQNPLVPHSFNNGSGQRVERLFTHRSNAIIALGSVDSKTYLTPVLANNTPPNTGTTLTGTQINQRLETEVQKIVDLYLANGTNGFLKPAHMQASGLGASSAFTESGTQDYFRLPADTVYTLAAAYPYLSSGLRTNVLSYLSAYWQRYFVDNRVTQIGWNFGTHRANFNIPPEVLTRMTQIGDITAGAMPQRTFYAAWKYAQIVPSQTASIYSAVRPALVHPMPTTYDHRRNPAVFNDFIAGYQGFINLYDLAGTNPDPTLRANVANSLATLLNTRLTNFAKDHPFYGSVDNPDGITPINNYTRTTNCMRNFMHMTPELGLAMRNSAQYSQIFAAVNEYYLVCPFWFMTRDHNTFQEASTRPIYDTPAIFQTKAYVLGQTQSELSKWIDVPWMLGDLYHIQNLTATMTAGGTAPPPPPTDTTPPTVSLTAPANGSTATGSVTVSANASDNVGIVGVQFLLDGVALGAEDTSSPYSISWNSAQATNGAHVLTARARDAAGNQTTSSPINVTVSNTVQNFTLTVSKTGTGSGTVTGTGINCGTDCTESVVSGTSVTLSASPATGSTFAGWSGGGCGGTGTCAVTVSANTTVTATFNTTATQNNPPVGNFDEITSTGIIRGWSYDPDASSTSNEVHIYFGPAGQGGTLIAGFPTDILRADVNQNFSITGNHGFEFNIPTQYRDGVTRQVYVYGIDTSNSAIATLLPGSPRSFTLGTTQPPPPGGPLAISGISASSSVPRYEKQEITFIVGGGSATNYNLPYDPSAPAGVLGTSGITVNVQFSQNNFATSHTIPAFYYQNFDYQTRSNRDWIAPTDQFSWKARFAPTTTGTWQYRIVATDASGTVTSPTQTFSATSSSNKGFIRVSPTDSRYFEFEDGTPFTGLGYNGGINWFGVNPISTTNSTFQTMGTSGAELARTWLSQSAIYGSSWNPWYGLRGDYGGYVPRTGLTPLGTEMTLRMTYAESGGNRNTGFFEACRFLGGFSSGTAIKRNTNYSFKVTYRGFNIAGPRNSTFPNYGLVLKMQNPQNGNWHTNCFDAGSNNTNGLVISPYGVNNTDFTVLEGEWNSGSNDFLPPFYMALENVNATSPSPGVYIRNVEIREKLLDGSLIGPNVASKPSMAHQLYFDQKNSFVFDRMVEQAKQHGVYLKAVVLEKDDDILGTLQADGTFGAFSAANFYGNYRSVTATRWLQQAWWRYLQARWGYSTNIHSWELVNEGDPNSDRHYTLTDEFGKYIRQFAPNHHLVTTSFWHSLPANSFWKSSTYPNVDYADLHAYVSTSQTGEFNITAAKDSVVRALCGTNNTCFKNAMKDDAALYRSEHSLQARDRALGKPLIRGEAGLDFPTQQVEETNLTRDNNGVWLHNLIWSQLDPGGMYDLYWWTSNINQRPGPDGSTANGLHELFTPARDFLSNIPITNGNYQDVAATVSNASSIRVLGQKDIVNRRAHAWIQNRKHTWCGVVGSVSTCTQIWDNSRLSGTVTISGFAPSTSYTADWWYFSNTGALTRPAVSTLTSNSSGNIIINLDTLPSTVVDTAVKIGNYSGGTTPPPPPPPPGAPVINSFTASPTSITSGQSSTLSWNVSDSTSLSINQGIGTVTGTSRSVTPTTTTTYTLTATNASGSTTANTTVTITAPANLVPVGNFDEITSTGIIRGWTYDPNTSSTSNEVHIYFGPAGAGGTLITGFATNVLRTDVNQNFGITGNHGFEYNIPTQYRDGVTRQVYVYGIDTSNSAIATLLPGSPRSFTLSPTTPLVGDINLDGIVNSVDYSILNSDWFTSNSRSDLNSDGIVNAIDFSLMNANWLRTSN